MQRTLGNSWWVRKLIYVIVAVVGLVATGVGFVSPDLADSWLSQSGNIAAAVGGIVAALFTGRFSDNRIPIVKDLTVNTISPGSGDLPVYPSGDSSGRGA